jgi:hypothetical protein
MTAEREKLQFNELVWQFDVIIFVNHVIINCDVNEYGEAVRRSIVLSVLLGMSPERVAFFVENALYSYLYRV